MAGMSTAAATVKRRNRVSIQCAGSRIQSHTAKAQ
ncbi:protein of unknown function [Methylorubrum extorquens DM4]|uniref:Uncharacterized protein n=1 Tax=Methylorubrum extorquens (strain DSM 6343 / CIP 106787 / DM4) TaxID=661410 RepID=A0A2P9HBH6_METED|nr:protein of unknown function [Methylorubrum extorquens DM4]